MLEIDLVDYKKKRKDLFSSEYKEFLNLHAHAHKNFIKINKGSHHQKDIAFKGNSLLPHIKFIKKLIKDYKCKSLLDYGCGKALVYFESIYSKSSGEAYKNIGEYWSDIKKITFFDPCYEKFNNFPNSLSDITVCTDVLEHIPEKDLGWVTEELFILSKKLVFIAVPTYLSSELLDGNINTHLIVKDGPWWRDKIESVQKKFIHIDYYLVYRYNSPDGRKNRLLTSRKKFENY